ncbi:MAG: O-antigen ligase family protein [Thermoflexales bacterium]|nr:O-antigen ligase family protein [Thermoflexales bacterium]
MHSIRTRSAQYAIKYIGLAALALVTLGAACVALVPRWAPATFAGMGVTWAVYALTARRLSVRTPADGLLACLALMIPVTLWATPLPDLTWPAVYQLAAGLVVYYVVVNFCAVWAALDLAELGLRLVTWGLAGTGVVLSALAMLGVQWIPKLPAFKPLLARLPATLIETINPNVMGGILAVLVSALIGWCWIGWPEHRRAERAALVTVNVGMIGVLVLTQSRGAWMGLAAALVALVLLVNRRSAWGVGLLALMAAMVVWRLGLERVSSLLLTSQAIRSVDSRAEIWLRAWYIIQDFPLTGLGMGAFRPVVDVMYPLFLAGPEATIPHAHNVFLQVAVDLGLPGLLAWGGTLVLVIAAAWRTYRLGKALGERWLMGLGAGVLCSQVALVMHGLTDAVTWNTRPAVLVWALWGLAIAAAAAANDPLGPET